MKPNSKLLRIFYGNSCVWLIVVCIVVRVVAPVLSSSSSFYGDVEDAVLLLPPSLHG